MGGSVYEGKFYLSVDFLHWRFLQIYFVWYLFKVISTELLSVIGIAFSYFPRGTFEVQSLPNQHFDSTIKKRFIQGFKSDHHINSSTN